MRIVFATAELRPIVSAGGLGEAAAGLAAALRDRGIDVITAIPGYAAYPLDDEQIIDLDVPEWAQPARARLGDHPEAGRLAVIEVPGIERPDPYVDAAGEGWPDNDARFAAFAAGVAALTQAVGADLVQLNDWHTALAPAWLPDDMPVVLTIHNLAHQGWADSSWLHRLPRHRHAYAWGGAVNSLAGAVRVADRVVTVSPNYAAEITSDAAGMGLQDVLAERGHDLRGILNGIDTRAWNPATDTYAPPFDVNDLGGKAAARAALLERVGWDDTGDPMIVMITRLVQQKGVDLAFESVRFLDVMNARMIVLGSGEARYGEWGHWLGETKPDRFWFFNGFDAPLSHLLFAGGDLLLMPSRFEPCGLAQMQAMAYGTIPVVTPVGGLVDTVTDVDADPRNGTGVVAVTLDDSGIVDAIHRGLRAWRHAGRRKAIQRRGMTPDWSWTAPAAEFESLYRELI